MIYYVFLIIVSLLLLLLLKIQVEIKVIIKDGKNFSFIIIRFLVFFRLRMNLSLKKDGTSLIALTLRKIDSDTETKPSLEQFWEAARSFKKFYGSHVGPFRYFKTKVKFSNFSVRSCIGTGDAASTALTIGSCYAFFTFISRYLYRNYQLQKSKLHILPDFTGPFFDLDLDCIINFKFGHIIIAGLKLLTKKEKAVS